MRGLAAGLGTALVLGLGIWGATRPPAHDGPPIGPWREAWLEQQLERERAGTEVLEQRVAELQGEVEALDRELLQAEMAIMRQEEAFQSWLAVLASLSPELEPAARDAAVEVGLAESAEPEVVEEGPGEPAEDPSLVRAAELAGLLRGLLRSEEISGLDLLEPGRFDDGRLGPVVFRTLDDRGRLTGSISAESLHLEAGLAARMVTIVLTRGRETAGGEATPFAELRLPFPRVDPRPWLEVIPELFEDPSLLVEGDDGLHDVEALRGRLNELLGRDAVVGFHRLRHMGGVRGETLLDLHLVEHGPSGRVLRHDFADEATLGLEDRGASLVLTGAVAVRGERKTPFPGGRLRIYLPRADHADWKAAELPGIAAD